MPTQSPLIGRGVSGTSSVQPKSKAVTMPNAQRQAISALEQAKISEEQFFADENLSITENPPERWVMMHVSMYGADQYQIFLGTSGIKLTQTTPKKCPNLALGEMIQNEELSKTVLPRNIWRLTKGYAYPSLMELDQQLAVLCQHFENQEWYLVIADHTDFEIPWEMIKFPKHGYLGAAFTVIRWHDIGTSRTETCSGKILAYVLDELSSAKSERHFFQNTFNVKPFDDIKAFRNQLQKNEVGYGFIYMACHGTFFQINPQTPDEQGILNVAFGSGSPNSEQQKLYYLDLVDLPCSLIKQSQSLVFLNFCQSGRHRVDDKFFRDDYRRGFAELFLTKGARGVIGTLAQVHDTYAAEIAHRFIQAALRSPHLPIAVLLRHLRIDAAKQLSDDPTDEELLQFLYTFLYVYYGNPTTKLHLTTCEESDNEP
ncbi:MAG: hypothetical protein DRR19_00975 [Candidatus Parabeggiatoa sp. nov. 1]|nr:MAG: hypothetical protein DRR19_00975 [Gammaproteobacteria bacterium]